MRTVSLFGPEGGEPGGGRTEADNGVDAVGGFGGGKKLVDEMSSAAGWREGGAAGPLVSRSGS